MPTTKEFNINMEDRPSTLGKLCRALADRNVNIIAFQSAPLEGKAQVHLVVDNPTTARTVLDSERLSYKEVDVVRVVLPHRAGELARAAERLGEAKININFAYCGVEPGKNEPVLFFGVADASRAATILDQAVSAAAGR
ncbi:MAG TPA: ACT domain-containing protein [Candidatus Cybelea sp.]|nr:ACT domain-containing protein [Candidatus Cybelea sp.]